jgi:hypothetical protein
MLPGRLSRHQCDAAQPLFAAWGLHYSASTRTFHAGGKSLTMAGVPSKVTFAHIVRPYVS